jgi:uncharacterized BrkB/YihY/UPF0761 family membrane protein
MARRNLIKKNKNNVFSIFGLAVIFLFLSLIIPWIGIGPTSSSLWVSIVDFFESIKNHFAQYWMFYTFAVAVLFAYMGNKK